MSDTIRHPNAANSRLARKRKASRKVRTRQNRHAARQYIRTHLTDEGYQDRPLVICDKGCCF